MNTIANNFIPTTGHRFNLLLVGEAGVGKTTFIKRHKTGEFTKYYTPTNTEVTSLDFSFKSFETTDGGYNYKNRRFPEKSQDFYKTVTCIKNVEFDVMEIGIKCEKIEQDYYDGADCAIVMIDLTCAKDSFDSVFKNIKTIQNKCYKIPIVVVANKADCKDAQYHKFINYNWKQKGIKFYMVSSKTNLNFEKPFLYLTRQLFMNQSLKISH